MKNKLIIIFLTFITAGSFFLRLHNCMESQWRSTDELLFLEMAKQIREDFHNYNATTFTNMLEKEGRYVPHYMREPLYKHPPMFTYAVATSISLFGKSETAAAIPAILFGTLLIPLTYLLGKLLFSESVALLSAFYMALDPIATIASQKIWMDTMLAFLTVISIYWFSVGLFKNKNFYFILSGIASGLAINTKYTGYLATIAILIYTLLDQRELFKNKIFLFSLFLPLFMLVPWLVWNFNVYGMSSLNVQGAMHTGVGEILDVLAQKGHLLLLLAFIGLTTYHFTKKKLAHCERAQTDDEENENTTTSNKLGLLLGYIVVGLICLRLSPYIYHAFLLHSLPSHSWQIGYFHGQPPWFYCGRLIEFSFPYLFGILTLFTYQADRSDEKRLAVISVGTIMLFFICWGNYQSRYILPCLPLLLLLSLEVVVRIVKYLNEHSADLRWRILRIGFFFAWLLFFYHTTYINVKVSYPNDLCYF